MSVVIHWEKSVAAIIKASAVSTTTAAILPVLRDWRQKGFHLFQYLCNEVQGCAPQKKNYVIFIEFQTYVAPRQNS